MIKKVEGIVVSEVDYKESSKILNIITKNDGMIGVIAKGSKRLKSFVKAGRFSYGYFHIYYHENGLSILKEVNIINSFRNIFSDLERTSYSMLILELSYYTYMESKEPFIYNILVDSLNKIDEGYNSKIISLIVEFKYLEYLGIKPVLDGCVTCGSKSIVTLSSYKGGYLCYDCLDNEIVVLDKTMKFAGLFYYLDISKITKCDISDKVIKELRLFIDDYYDRYSGLYIKSKKVIKDLLKEK